MYSICILQAVRINVKNNTGHECAAAKEISVDVSSVLSDLHAIFMLKKR